MAQNFLRHFHFWSFFPVDRSIRTTAAQVDETAIFCSSMGLDIGCIENPATPDTKSTSDLCHNGELNTFWGR